MPRKAVTLIELVIVIVLVGILAGGVSLYFTSAIDTWRFISFRSEIVSQARASLLQMTRKIRQIKQPSQSQETIEAADLGSFQFIRLHESGSDERIRYRSSGEDIFYDLDSNVDGSFEGSYVLMDGVSNFGFSYYDDAGAQLSSLPLSQTDRGKIYRIEVSFDITEGDQSKSLDISIFPRNLKW